ncbi:MAG: hypothetical protein CSA66_00660 [Proteobacteria bacterium]|nr:MAG: hypothetical protein CSA66_00660 [Pseudomonadota bacterium]
MSAKEASSVRMMLTLGVAGLISGGVLVGIYLVTAPVIAQNRAEALERAIYEVVPGATSNRAFVMGGDGITPFAGEGMPKEPAVYAGFDDSGAFVGFAVPAEGSGFQDVIKLIVGYVPAEDRVIGMRVLESRETPGLGDKIIKDDKFVGQFDDLTASPEITVTKKGATLPSEIDAISGATISSKAVARIINEGLGGWRDKLPPTVAAEQGSD